MDLNVKDSSGDTLALWALKKDKMDMFNILLQRPGVDLNAKDASGDTAVLWALKNSKLEVVRQLVPRVNVTSTDRNGDNLEKIARLDL